MARRKRWTQSKLVHGVVTVELFSWKYFHDFIDNEVPDFKHQLWRGQRCDDWLLESTLDRVLKQIHNSHWDTILADHLERFKHAIRGRRGSNPPLLEKDNDWWTLGRHQGLDAPLLDWVTSPFVASYFAFIREDQNGQTPRRAIYSLDRTSVEEKSEEITKRYQGTGRSPIIEFVRPLSDDNPRLIAQGGLFTRAPTGEDIKTWVQREFRRETGRYILRKIMIPNNDRLQCLRSLNRMNINHLTLFPDLYGASKFCNLSLRIRDY